MNGRITQGNQRSPLGGNPLSYILFSGGRFFYGARSSMAEQWAPRGEPTECRFDSCRAPFDGSKGSGTLPRSTSCSWALCGALPPPALPFIQTPLDKGIHSSRGRKAEPDALIGRLAETWGLSSPRGEKEPPQPGRIPYGMPPRGKAASDLWTAEHRDVGTGRLSLLRKYLANLASVGSMPLRKGKPAVWAFSA